MHGNVFAGKKCGFHKKSGFTAKWLLQTVWLSQNSWSIGVSIHAEKGKFDIKVSFDRFLKCVCLLVTLTLFCIDGHNKITTSFINCAKADLCKLERGQLSL